MLKGDRVKAIVEVLVIDVEKGESIFIPEHLVVGKVRQCKDFKRVYLYPSQEKLQRLIMAQYETEDVDKLEVLKFLQIRKC